MRKKILNDIKKLLDLKKMIRKYLIVMDINSLYIKDLLIIYLLTLKKDSQDVISLSWSNWYSSISYLLWKLAQFQLTII